MIGVDYYVGDFLSDICNGDGEEVNKNTELSTFFSVFSLQFIGVWMLGDFFLWTWLLVVSL